MDVSIENDERNSGPPSEPEEAASSPPTGRRRSGRAKRKPEHFSPETYSTARTAAGGTAKRKRSAPREGGGGDDNDASESGEGGAEESETEETGESEGEADEEELKERKKAARKPVNQKKKANKKTRAPRAAKKPKIANGVGTELVLRPAVNGEKPPAKAKKPRIRPSDFAGEDGLYAEVFARGHTTEAAAAEWLTKYEQHNINAMCDLVNFVLKCTGTDLKVNVHDIEDVDNVPSRLTDLQDEYQAQDITEYPLISKVKKFRAFQPTLEGFFDALMKTLHSASVLYNDSALIENIQVWISSMSSALIRPFRHTATIVSLAIVNALCHVAREVSTTVSNSRKQMETEKKKRSANKGRIGAMQSKVQEGEKKLETIDEILRDSFDTVFVHRYRDVDPKIRAECMTALGNWISTYREMFFEGQYLRYLGWVLSDTNGHTRAVVVNQLHSLFENKDNVAGLRGFIERFRPRIVEIAARDAEPPVRAAAVDLLDLIRDAGLLEPEDIDTVGQLVFDAEPRVRKAAGKFFVANIQDVYENATEGLEEELSDSFMDEDDDNFEAPRQSWIKYKCLVDMLLAYDGQESDVRPDEDSSTSRGGLVVARLDSRFVLATEAIYPHLEELDHWESLAGYLLYDHSQIPEPATDDDAANAVKNLYKLDEGQEAILLEVLVCSVKLNILEASKPDPDKKGRKTKLSVERMEERQELIAHSLSRIIPRLLNKFGAVPQAAFAVLRLEHLLNLDLIQDLQKEAAAYSDLIGDINKQFLTHSHQGVLAEATVAFLHAKTSDELKEAMESKIQELWDDTLDALRNLSRSKGKQDPPSFSTSVLTELSNTVMRISKLASISDCTSILEASPATKPNKQKSQSEPSIDTLLKLARRGLREADSDESEQLEQALVTNCIHTLLVYFMWKVKSITSALSSSNPSLDSYYLETLSRRREAFVEILTAIMQQRSGINELRLAATITLLDLQTVFGTIRHAGASGNNTIPVLDDEIAFQIQDLVQDISPETQLLVSRIHDAVERMYAKKIRRTLEPSDEDEPMESDSETEENAPQNEDDDDEKDDSAAAERARATLLAEQKLCELTGKIVLAIIGRVLDASGPQHGKLRQKLLRHKTRLGHNYKEVLAYLDDQGGGARKRRSLTKDQGKSADDGANGDEDAAATSGQVKGNGKKKMKSAERIHGDDEDEDEDMHIEEDGEDDLRARELLEDDGGRPDAGADDDNDGEAASRAANDDDALGD